MVNTEENSTIAKYKVEDNGEVIEYELVPFFKTSDSRSNDVISNLDEVNKELEENAKQLEVIKSQIDINTNHADKLDCVVAACCGIMAGFIDVFFVGRFDFRQAKAWSNKTVNEFVMNVAKKSGYKGDRLDGAIKFLEDHYKVANDNSFSGSNIGVNPKSHHLDDFAHHPNIVGLFFSLLTQFTGNAYYSNSSGAFKIVPANPVLIGKNIFEKISFGTINWFFHLVSDMSGSNKTAGAGMGIPGPIMSLAKEISALPGINKLNIAPKLKEMYEKEHFDLRAELAVAHELSRQAVPVILNEILVRTFYFIRRFVNEYSIKRDISRFEWKKVLPFKNATITRMMTIASGAFCVVDIGDAVIKSGGNWQGFLLRVNFVGVFRFTLAVGDEISYAIKREKWGNEYFKVLNERIALFNLKISYQEYGMWLVAKDTLDTIMYTNQQFLNYVEEYKWRSENIDNNINRVRNLLNIQYSKIDCDEYPEINIDKNIDKLRKLLK